MGKKTSQQGFLVEAARSKQEQQNRIKNLTKSIKIKHKIQASKQKKIKTQKMVENKKARFSAKQNLTKSKNLANP